MTAPAPRPVPGPAGGQGPSGVALADTARTRLAQLGGPDDAVAVLTDVHRLLQDALASLNAPSARQAG